jgi:hypothetical protein
MFDARRTEVTKCAADNNLCNGSVADYLRLLVFAVLGVIQGGWRRKYRLRNWTQLGLPGTATETGAGGWLTVRASIPQV